VIYAATERFELKQKRIATPLCETAGHELRDEIVLIPILRAGVSRVETAIASSYSKKLRSIARTSF
jgi:uracil phosphoribosyltransferase